MPMVGLYGVPRDGAERENLFRRTLRGLFTKDILQLDTLGSILQLQGGIAVSGNDEACGFPMPFQLRIGHKSQGSLHGKRFGGELLREQVGTVPESAGRLLHAVQPDPSVRQRLMPVRTGNSRILPGQIQAIRADRLQRFGVVF